MNSIDIKEKFRLFDDYWNPRIIGELNGQLVKIAKFKGEFEMHKHDHEDELFQVIQGNIKIEFENETVSLNEGEMIVVPRGVLHKPSADEEAWVMMFEPASTINTGENKPSDLTRDNLQKL
ncbi:MAG: cupin domain-containing protein [Reichenbachiella sp.]|uniref:cupin domain-containing protein n=1 Tax=Reichenbachiella sp. TaxID=2184521 RepID=UPI003264E479